MQLRSVLGQVSLGQHPAVMPPCDTSVFLPREKFFLVTIPGHIWTMFFVVDFLTIPTYCAWVHSVEPPQGACAEFLWGETALDDVLQISLKVLWLLSSV